MSSLLRVVGPVYWLVICSPEFLGRVWGVSLVEFVNLTVFFFVVSWPDPRFGVVDWYFKLLYVDRLICSTLYPMVIMGCVSHVELVERKDIIVLQDEFFVGRNP